MLAVTFTIFGKPHAKQRHKFVRATGRTYTPTPTVDFEAHVGATARSLFKVPMIGPVRLTLLATFKPPVSWSKKKRASHLGTFHTQKPDLDNLEKSFCDGLNRIAFADDSQIAEIHCRKMWGEDEGTLVMIEALT